MENYTLKIKLTKYINKRKEKYKCSTYYGIFPYTYIYTYAYKTTIRTFYHEKWVKENQDRCIFDMGQYCSQSSYGGWKQASCFLAVRFYYKK